MDNKKHITIKVLKSTRLAAKQLALDMDMPMLQVIDIALRDLVEKTRSKKK